MTTFYCPGTGEILVSSVRDLTEVEHEAMLNMLPEGTLSLPGFANRDSAYVVGGEFIDIPAKPDGFYEWSYIEKAWRLNKNALMGHVTSQRNALLSKSDWTQLPDVPLATKEAWALYRQALRDITDKPGWPANVLWPKAPG